jgi:RNA polymerase sigma factor (sigma-70 family)
MAIETLGAALRQLNRLFADGVVAGLSDAQLLERFLSQGDAGSFEALVGRHGPMVLSVCGAILRDPHDAEDAFQATFLVLARTGSTIRGRDALAGWLHRVAHRVANRANVAAARRRRLERQVGQMAVATRTNGPAASDELRRALHEEIARLPEKYRLAVVQCDLEGKNQAAAAGQLHWSRRALQLRLAEGRARLRRRLARRGLAPDGAALGAVLLREAQAAVPVAWREATVRAAVVVVSPAITALAVSATAQQLAQEVYKIMLLKKLASASAALFAAGLIGWGAAAALISLGQEAPQGASAPRVSTARPTSETAGPRPKPAPADAAGTFPARGRVLDPDGKPVAGALVYVRPYAEPRWSDNDPMAARQKGRVASTGADGRFHFELDKGASDGSYWRAVIGWHKAQIAAAAPGFAPAWVEAGDMVKRGEVALSLVRDDVPVRGRVVDSQGRPVAGVVVRIRAIWEVNNGIDLDAMLASGAVDEEDMLRIARRYGDSLGWVAPAWRAGPTPLWPGGRNTWTTGADGRFEVQAIGRDRIARLEFHGGGVADGTLDVMARPAKALPKARPLSRMRREVAPKGREAAFLGLSPQGTQLAGATFDYIAGPTKPIVGVVRLKGPGKPVEGAIVLGVDPGTHTAVTARTDAAGRFRLEGVPKGEFYQIQVNPRQGIDPFLRRWEIIDDTEGLKPIEVAVEVPQGVIVTGRLIDKATGRVVPPGEVEYTKAPDNVANGDSLGFSRLADGAFGLTVPPGRGMIAGAAAVEGTIDPYVAAHLKAADRRENTIEDRLYPHKLVGQNNYRFIDVPAGSGPLAVDLELTRGPSRAGRLTGPDGLPVVGALAYGLSSCDWGGTQRSRALDADTFEVGGLEPGHPRLLVFTHAARKLVGATVLKDEDLKSSAPLEVKLVPAGAITGRLLDDDGLPWAGATLRVWMSDPDRPPSLGFGCAFGETVTADSQGRFRVEAFVPGVETEVTIAAPNRGGAQLDGGNFLRKPTLKPGELRDLGDVKAKEIHQQ